MAQRTGPAKPPGARRGSKELQAARARSQKLNRSLRQARQTLRQLNHEVARLKNIEGECEALRRELGPQRPLLQMPEAAAVSAREPWVPAVVETHLTALHDQDVAAVAALLTPDAVVIEAPFPDASVAGKEQVVAFHANLLSKWTDFRFMPLHWHNLGGAAFLEGEATFVQRGERCGLRADGKVVTMDMFLIYHLAAGQIARLKLYYDAAGLRRQLARPGVQGELF